MRTIQQDETGKLQCTKCKKRKHVDCFHHDSARACGFSARCRECTKKRSAARNAKLEVKARKRELDAKPDVIERKRKHHALWLHTPSGKRWTMWRSAKERAKRLGIPFTIEIADIPTVTHCPLLGIALAFNNRGFSHTSPSLDRILPELGYVPGNVWVISFRANAIKHDASLAEIETLVRNLAHRIQGR